MGTCLECEEHIEIDENVEVGDIIECPGCKTQLEVLDLHPVSFDYAPDPTATRGSRRPAPPLPRRRPPLVPAGGRPGDGAPGGQSQGVDAAPRRLPSSLSAG